MTFWSAGTCHRFGPADLSASKSRRFQSPQGALWEKKKWRCSPNRRRQVGWEKAVTSPRTPKGHRTFSDNKASVQSHRKFSGKSGRKKEKISRAEDFSGKAEENSGQTEEKIGRAEDFSGLFFLPPCLGEDFSGQKKEKTGKRKEKLSRFPTSFERPFTQAELKNQPHRRLHRCP